MLSFTPDSFTSISTDCTNLLNAGMGKMITFRDDHIGYPMDSVLESLNYRLRCTRLSPRTHWVEKLLRCSEFEYKRFVTLCYCPRT